MSMFGDFLSGVGNAGSNLFRSDLASVRALPGRFIGDVQGFVPGLVGDIKNFGQPTGITAPAAPAQTDPMQPMAAPSQQVPPTMLPTIASPYSGGLMGGQQPSTLHTVAAALGIPPENAQALLTNLLGWR